MSSGVYQVTGAAELRKTLHAAGADLADLTAVNKRVGDVVATAARPRVPVRSGRLVGSLHPTVTAGKVTVSSSLRYAGPLHWGWPAHHVSANPFLSDAATSTEQAWVDLYFREVQDIVNQVEGA